MYFLRKISSITFGKVEGNCKIQDTREIIAIAKCSPETLPLRNLSHDHDRQLQDYLQGIATIA